MQKSVKIKNFVIIVGFLKGRPICINITCSGIVYLKRIIFIAV